MNATKDAVRRTTRLLDPNRLWALSVARYRLFHRVPGVRGFLDRLLAQSEREGFALARHFRPATPGRKRSAVEIRTLLCHQHVDMYLWAIRALLHFSDLDCPVIVHDDGSLTREDVATLRQSVPWLEVLARREADAQMGPLLAAFPWCQRQRANGVSTLKLLDMPLLARSTHTLHFDSDILCLRTPEVLSMHLLEPDNVVRYNREFGGSPYNRIAGFTDVLGEACDDLNAGLMLMPNDIVRLTEIEPIAEWVNTVGVKQGCRVDDQLVYAVLLSRRKHESLPAEYATYWPHSLTTALPACLHYHTVSKRYMAFQGVSFLLRCVPSFSEAVF